jgi:DNA repair exonuclease SbcCD ATPase subunit
MIPVALALKGFLSFHAEQRLAFEQDQVWLLSGPNGSGKSAVFDAILFALYAGHRAGKADLHELINKDADRALVRFDFELGGQRYRAERAVERTTDRKTGRPGYASTQQLFGWSADEGAWHPIAGTQRQSDFHEWVREHVGLSFDAFTSSALLMQGRADVLVAQDAEAARRRFEVLSRIVGLDAYEALYRRADEQRKHHEKRAGELQAQLEVIEPVDPATMEGLTCRSAEIVANLAVAEQELEQLNVQKTAAARWRELRAQRADKQSEWDATAHLLGDAAAIERDGARFEELRTVLPALERLAVQRAQVVEAEAATATLAHQKQQLLTRDAEVATALAQLEREIEQSQVQHAVADRERRDLATAQQQQTLALSPLRRLHRACDQLRNAHAAAERVRARLGVVEANLRRRQQAVAAHTQALAAAAEAHRDAARQATSAETRVTDFEDQARRFAEVAAAKVCGYCGQALDAEHARRERRRLTDELNARKSVGESARDALVLASAEEMRCQDVLRAAEAELAKIRQQTEAFQREHERAGNQRRAHAQAAHDAYAELPDTVRTRVSPQRPVDWTTITFPAADDIAILERSLADTVERLQALDHAAAERENALACMRQRQQQAEDNRAALRQELAGIDNSLIQQNERIMLVCQQLEPARAALPPHWQCRAAEVDAPQLQGLTAELARLTQREAAGRWQQLRTAQASQAPLRRDLDEIDAELAHIPRDARREPDELEPLIRAAKQREVDLRNEGSTLQAEKRQLEQLQERRDRLSTEFRAADRRRHLSARLAELLSRRHLQRHLLRQAEAGIVANTNQVLDRISGGRLAVRLLPEEENDDSRALQLEAYKPDTRQSFGLSFLSGSERFRVAISLALGIGQYASRQHRAIESVIIDEGFGCLDRDNRRTMIEELEHLRGQLRCILLVSHQEEFADAFPDGYRFRLTDGMTRVERSE